MTRIAVAGGTGVVGRQVVDELTRGGHDVSVIARSRGVDVQTGQGLAAAVESAAAVIDVVGTQRTAGERRESSSEVVRTGDVPWTILRAAQFHEFAEHTRPHASAPASPT